MEPKPPAKPPDAEEKLKEEAEPNPDGVAEDVAAGGAAKENEAAEEEPKPEEDDGADDPNPVLLPLVGAAKEKEATDEGADDPNPLLLLPLGAAKLKLLAWTAGAAPKSADNQRDCNQLVQTTTT